MKPTNSDHPRPSLEPLRPTRIALIAAVERSNGIGRGNQLLWRESADLKRFKALTLGHPVIMGRKTWDSIGRPLPGRRNIVVTRQPQWSAPGAESAASIQSAIAMVAGAPLAFVIGGAQVYAEALPLADELHLTEIDTDLEADAFFPAWPREAYAETASVAAQDANGIRYRFVTYERIR